MRKHAMHGAVMLGLLCCLGAIANVIRVLSSGKAIDAIAMSMTVAMGVVSGIFVALCIRSFIQARKARMAKIGA